MTNRFASYLIAACALFICATASFSAKAQSDASALSGLSALPVASIAVGASAVAGSVVAVPLVLSTAGAALVIKTVESTARGTLYVLERASDGASASIEIVGKGIGAASMVAGASVVVGVVGAGVVLSAAGEAIAFIPNALGRALLHNERLTH
ncbi:MAG: hypothetical protein JWP96_1175 [Polaromonas sp.]|nr:hypothetical protein [Polaromonas sp.]